MGIYDVSGVLVIENKRYDGEKAKKTPGESAIDGQSKWIPNFVTDERKWK